MKEQLVTYLRFVYNNQDVQHAVMKTAYDRLREMDCEPIWGLIKQIKNESDKNVLKKVIDQADIYLLFADASTEDVDMFKVEKEYAYAKKLGKVIFIILQATEETQVKSKMLEALCKAHFVLRWEKEEELSQAISMAIYRAQRKRRNRLVTYTGLLIITLLSLTVFLILFEHDFYFNEIPLILLTTIWIMSGITVYYRVKRTRPNEDDYSNYLKKKLWLDNQSLSNDSADLHTNKTQQQSGKQIAPEDKDIIALMLKNTSETTEYFSISKNQAKKSFFFSILFCSLGVTTLICASFMAFFTLKLEPAIITAIGGAIMEVIAGTILWVHNKSALQLNHYYNALHQNENFLSAVTLADRADEKTRNDLYCEIVRSLLNIKGSPL